MEVIIRYRGKEFVIDVDSDHCLTVITKKESVHLDVKEDGKIKFRKGVNKNG